MTRQSYPFREKVKGTLEIGERGALTQNCKDFLDNEHFGFEMIRKEKPKRNSPG
jgi:hypothetical protein